MHIMHNQAPIVDMWWITYFYYQFEKFDRASLIADSKPCYSTGTQKIAKKKKWTLDQNEIHNTSTNSSHSICL